MARYRYIHGDGRASGWLDGPKGSYHAMVEALGRDEANEVLGLETSDGVGAGQYRYDSVYRAEVAELKTPDGELVGRILRT